MLKFCTIQNAIAIGFLLRLSIAFWNGFLGPSFGAGIDAVGFHLGGVSYASGFGLTDFEISHAYIYALGTIYQWLTPSLFLGSFMSCVAWLGAAILLAQMTRMLKLGLMQRFEVMLIFALLPSSIFLTSVTLREAYQLLAVNLVAFSVLKIYITKSAWYWLWLVMGVTLMGVSHGGLLTAGLIILVGIFLLTFLEKRGPYFLLKLSLIIVLLILVTYIGSSQFLEVVFNANSGLASTLQARQDNWQQSARAAYSIGIRLNSDADLLLFIPAALFHYLFQPMPWRASTTLDWLLILENLLRAYLLYRVIAGIFLSPYQGKIYVGLIFFIYLLIETIWSLGTINWGTAARHHIPTLGLLLLSGFAFPAKWGVFVLKQPASKGF